VIDKSENFQALSKSICNSKVMYLASEVTAYDIYKYPVENLLLEEKIQKYLHEYMQGSAQANKIKLELLDIHNEQFRKNVFKFQKLKLDITLANTLQDNMMDRKRTDKSQKIFVYTPKIQPDHAELSKIAGTPFFAFCGTFSVRASPKTPEANKFIRENRTMIYNGNYFYFYHMILHVESGEMVYRELRKIPAKVSENILYTTVYDSFYTLKKQLNK
jgi:hypothetical protein